MLKKLTFLTLVLFASAGIGIGPSPYSNGIRQLNDLAAMKVAICDIFVPGNPYSGTMIQVRALIEEKAGEYWIRDAQKLCSAPILVMFPSQLKPRPDFEFEENGSLRQIQEAVRNPMEVEATLVGRLDTLSSAKRGGLFGKWHNSLIRIVVRKIFDVTGDWWQNKDHHELTVKEADEILNESPWAAWVPAPREKTIFHWELMERWYKVRTLTARPVREAWLRTIAAIGSDQAKSISLGELSESGEQRLEAFRRSNPNDIRLSGDDENIVITLTANAKLKYHNQSRDIQITTDGREREVIVGETFITSRENTHPEELVGKSLSDFRPRTYISTDSGKRLFLVRFDPPGSDQLGGKFYFPRTLPDGSPFITRGDKELRFETRIDGKSVRAKFNLTNMKYKGKLEF